MKLLNLALSIVAALPLSAQTLVEHSLATGAASTAASGMGAVGKAAAAVFEKANQTLGTKEGAPTVVPVAVPAASNSARSEPVKLSPPPDSGAVKIGMTRADVGAKFGTPAMKVSSSDGAQTVETWTWGAGADAVTLTLRDGKVAAVNGPQPKPSASQTAVVILQ